MRKKRREEEVTRQLHYVVVGKNKKGQAIRRIYPLTPQGKKEADRDAEHAAKKGGRDIEIIED